MDDLHEDALQAIHLYVWSGMYDPDEVVMIVGESIWGEDYDEEWLEAEVEREVAGKRADEVNWPETTDCDRLDDALDELEAGGLIVLQAAGYTKSDGLEDVQQQYDDLGGAESGIEGYCYFTEQDLEGALKDPELYLSFGDMDGNEAEAVKIGRWVQRAVEEAGFKVEWSGFARERIRIKPFRWQRRND